jgi:sigma-B regulation protein RsbU (phosphoserine phosphatase)
VEKLETTGTVLGLFGESDCTVAQRTLQPADVLAVYTDGITEAYDDRGEEFGEERLVDALSRHRHLSPKDIITAVVDEVRDFMAEAQHDDITLTVAKCR